MGSEFDGGPADGQNLTEGPSRAQNLTYYPPWRRRQREVLTAYDLWSASRGTLSTLERCQQPVHVSPDDLPLAFVF